MRKTILLIMALGAAAFLFTACAPKKEAAEPAPTEKETIEENLPTAEETEEAVGMINPMVEIEDSGEFEEQLGIRINASVIAEDAKCFIISGKTAHVEWHQENVNAEDVELVLRATKDEYVAQNLHGIYGKPEGTAVIPVDISEGKTVEMTQMHIDNYGIYTWKDGGIYYSLTYDKAMSQMSLAEILDSVMDATGISFHKNNLTALPSGEELTDGIYPVDFDKTAIREEAGVYSVECELFSKEYFDAVEVSLMQAGDTITIGGDMVIEIKSIDRDGEDGVIIINSDVDGEEFMLVPGDGGTYYYRGLDDITSYCYRGTKGLEIAETVVLTDTADIENGCLEVVVNGAEEAVKHLQEKDYIYISHYSTQVRLEDSKIVEIAVVYTP